MAFYDARTDTVQISTTVPDTDKIHEWLPWSIINIFVGWGVGGICPMVFTLFCRHYKHVNNVDAARVMSFVALIDNIINTLSGIAGWIRLILILVQRS